jgi:aspartyl protease family protein
MSHLVGWVLCLGAADGTSLPDTLTKHGLVLEGSSIILPDEKAVHEELADLRPQWRRLAELEKKFDLAQLVEGEQQAQRTQLRREHANLTDALQSVPAGDFARHNQIVARLNQLTALLNRSDPDEQKQIKSARSEYESARAQVIKGLRSLAPRVKELERTYEELAGQKEVIQAIATLPERASKRPQLGPGRWLRADSKEIDRLMSRLQSEEIELRGDGGVNLVDVILNDETHAEFILDTGASLLCLPYALARKAGAEPTEESPVIEMKIADGRVIQGRLVRMRSVRVGPFEVENVECAVLPEEAREVEPLLGNSFLGEFEHQIDPANHKLILSRWGDPKSTKESDGPARSKRKSRASKNARD